MPEGCGLSWLPPSPPPLTPPPGNRQSSAPSRFNSRFKSEEIDAFGRLVARKGGRLIDHVYVRRGRILNQLSGNELMDRVRDFLDSRAGRWAVVGAVGATPESEIQRVSTGL
jgi:hypothetical protein